MNKLVSTNCGRLRANFREYMNKRHLIQTEYNAKMRELDNMMAFEVLEHSKRPEDEYAVIDLDSNERFAEIRYYETIQTKPERVLKLYRVTQIPMDLVVCKANKQQDGGITK